MGKLTPYLRALGVLIALTISAVLVFDLGCFFVLPENFSTQIFLGYRVGLLPDGGLGRGYPHDYFEPHAERGFDIGPSKSRRDHALFDYPRNYSYAIWSNSLGCFDSEHTGLERYIYLAGDSSTWGYTRFEKKFGALLEDKLGVPVVKCGVTHTGQQHQLSKMKDVIGKIGRPPAVIVVVWSPNDIINDAFYPHSTVIDGWQVDTVHISATRDVVREAPEALGELVRKRVSDWRSWLRKPKLFLLKHSVTYNILVRAFYPGEFGRWLASDVYDDPDRMSIYSLQRDSLASPFLPYSRDARARNNQEALLAIQAYADSIHATLLVALLSVRPDHNVEVRNFLREHSIKYVDAGTSGYNFSDKDLSWKIDPHANERGNEVIADVLYRFITSEASHDKTAVDRTIN